MPPHVILKQLVTNFTSWSLKFFCVQSNFFARQFFSNLATSASAFLDWNLMWACQGKTVWMRSPFAESSTYTPLSSSQQLVIIIFFLFCTLSIFNWNTNNRISLVNCLSIRTQKFLKLLQRFESVDRITRMEVQIASR